MSIVNVLEGISFEDTIQISFDNTASTMNFKFTRSNDMCMITIQPISFYVIAGTILTSITKIPDKYVPKEETIGYIIINGSLCKVRGEMIYFSRNDFSSFLQRKMTS